MEGENRRRGSLTRHEKKVTQSKIVLKKLFIRLELMTTIIYLPLFHVIQHQQIISMLLYFPLYLISQISFVSEYVWMAALLMHFVLHWGEIYEKETVKNYKNNIQNAGEKVENCFDLNDDVRGKKKVLGEASAYTYTFNNNKDYMWSQIIAIKCLWTCISLSRVHHVKCVCETIFSCIFSCRTKKSVFVCIFCWQSCTQNYKSIASRRHSMQSRERKIDLP